MLFTRRATHTHTLYHEDRLDLCDAEDSGEACKMVENDLWHWDYVIHPLTK